MTVLKHYIFWQTTREKESIKYLQQTYRVVHLHTNSNVSIAELWSCFRMGRCDRSSGIFVVVPVVDGVWELIVKE